MRTATPERNSPATISGAARLVTAKCKIMWGEKARRLIAGNGPSQRKASTSSPAQSGQDVRYFWSV